MFPAAHALQNPQPAPTGARPVPQLRPALPPVSGEAEAWHRCASLTLSDEAFERLHEFLQANLEGRWSLLPQDRDKLERYDVLVKIDTEAGLLDLFRVTIGMPG